MKLTTALFLFALCLAAQRVAADAHDDTCEAWVGDGGCDASCKFKCCVDTIFVCHDCYDDKYCVHDPEWCVDKLVEDCKIVPKHVCSHKPICEKVKKVVCKDEKEKKCEIIKEKVCKDIDDCKKVPVKKCDKVCDFKDICDDDDDDDGGSFARASGFASGGDSASASSFASASDDDAFAAADADATGDDSFARTDTFARVRNDDDRRRLLGCRREKICDDKCHTDYETKCEKKHVCEEIPKEVCKYVPVEKCYDEWHDVCKNVKKCDWIDEKVCKLVKIKVCKDKVKCGDYDCKEWEMCNPDCCIETKIAKCFDHY